MDLGLKAMHQKSVCVTGLSKEAVLTHPLYSGGAGLTTRELTNTGIAFGTNDTSSLLPQIAGHRL